MKTSKSSASCDQRDENEKRWQAEMEQRCQQALFGQSGVPKRHAVQHTDWTRSADQRKAFDMCVGKLGKGGALIALCGNRDTGKTQIAVELIRMFTVQQKRAAYIRATQFFMDIKSTYRPDATQSESSIIDDLCDPALLVIDEFHERSGSAWENSLLTYLVDKRYGDMMDTIIIANVTQAGLASITGPSIARRINDGGGTIECMWKGVTG